MSRKGSQAPRNSTSSYWIWLGTWATGTPSIRESMPSFVHPSVILNKSFRYTFSGYSSRCSISNSRHFFTQSVEREKNCSHRLRHVRPCIHLKIRALINFDAAFHNPPETSEYLLSLWAPPRITNSWQCGVDLKQRESRFALEALYP